MGSEMGNQDCIDIVLISHNNLKMTAMCIDRLYENTHIPFRLIIMDDSTDLTPDYIKWLQKDHDNITYVFREEGFKSGNQLQNIAQQYIQTDIYASITNNTWVEPDWLQGGWEVMKKMPDCGVVGFKLLKASGCIEHAGIYYEPTMPYHMNIGVDEQAGRYTHVAEVPIVGWALVLIRKIALPVGGLEEDYYIGFNGYDDIDNCLTIRKNGWKIYYCGFGCAYHYSLSTRGNEQKVAEYANENRLRFLARWGNVG